MISEERPMTKSLPKGLVPALAAFGLAGITLLLPAMAQTPAQGRGSGQGGVPVKGQTSAQFFKNVTTSTLKGLTPSDFLGAMGVMTAAVGYDCSNCHPGAGTDAMDWVTDRDPKKVTARKM